MPRTTPASFVRTNAAKNAIRATPSGPNPAENGISAAPQALTPAKSPNPLSHNPGTPPHAKNGMNATPSGPNSRACA